MASREIYTDLDLVKVSQILNTRLHNVTTTERNTLAGTLGGANEGLIVFDTTEKQIYLWDGSVFLPTKVQGAMVYKGTVTSLTTAPAGFEVGFTYVFTGTAGTLTWAGQTFSPDADVEVGDVLIYRGSNIWDIIEGNDDVATETTRGNIAIATQAEANAGTVTDKAIVPSTLSGYKTAKAIPSVYFNNAVTVAALTPLTITHNLGLQNKNSFVISVKDVDGSEITVDVDSATVNTLTLTSVVAITNLSVTVIGF